MDVAFTSVPEIEFRSGAPGVGVLFMATKRSGLGSRDCGSRGTASWRCFHGGVNVTNRDCWTGSRMFFMYTYSPDHLAKISSRTLTGHSVTADVAEFLEPQSRCIDSLSLKDP